MQSHKIYRLHFCINVLRKEKNNMPKVLANKVSIKTLRLSLYISVFGAFIRELKIKLYDYQQ